MSGKHEKVGSNKSLEDVDNDHDHDTPESRIFPFTIAHLESDEVRLMGRKAEILLLRESLLEALNANDRVVADRDELRQANSVLKRKLSESMSENVKLQAVINNLKNELQNLDILDPMMTVQKLKSESKKLETSISNRRTKIMNDHKELMERLELDHKTRKAELEQELRELVLLVDGEKDKLRHLQDQVSNLASIMNDHNQQPMTSSDPTTEIASNDETPQDVINEISSSSDINHEDKSHLRVIRITRPFSSDVYHKEDVTSDQVILNDDENSESEDSMGTIDVRDSDDDSSSKINESESQTESLPNDLEPEEPVITSNPFRRRF